VRGLHEGDVLLLENLRFYPEEEANDSGFAQKLAALADVYVNDAFSICHRKQTSIVSFPNHLPSCAGRLLEKELEAIEKLDVTNSLLILGGAKPEDNIKLIKANKENKILTCGFFCHLCLIASGIKLGEQEEYLKKEIKEFDEIIAYLKKNVKNLELPIDLAIENNGYRKEILIEELPIDKRIFDIGSKTIEKYISETKKAKSIFLKGPSGFYSDKKFRKGTYEILKAISKSKAFSLIGGGHSNEAIKKCRIKKKRFGYVSLSGGALISYLAGEKLPGLQALEKW